jgi:cell division protein FtsW (lipid II flippase)
MRALRRNTELGLVLLAGLVTTGAYVLAALGRTARMPADLGPFLGAVLGLLAAAHVATRRLAPDADPVLLPLAGLLNGLGYVFIARLDADLARLQAAWTAIGVAVFVATLAFVRRARDLERARYTLALAGIVLLLAPLAPGVGRTINGARLWVRVGPLNFQPGELAKIALAVFFASYLVERRELLAIATRRVGPVALPDLRHFGPVLAAWVLSLVVIMAERDLGSSLLFFALFVALLWVATGRGAYLAIGAAMFAAGALLAWAQFAHVQERVRVWFDPWPHAATEGYQIVQGWFALGSGGIAGRGLSLGSPQRIPAAATDFIFAAVGEELGLLGTTAVLAAFLLMVGAGLRIALRADHGFEKLLATGLTLILGLQSFIIIGGITRVVPLTGITLPFVSYGGSSLVANYMLCALLLRISDDEARRGSLR